MPAPTGKTNRDSRQVKALRHVDRSGIDFFARDLGRSNWRPRHSTRYHSQADSDLCWGANAASQMLLEGMAADALAEAFSNLPGALAITRKAFPGEACDFYVGKGGGQDVVGILMQTHTLRILNRRGDSTCSLPEEPKERTIFRLQSFGVQHACFFFCCTGFAIYIIPAIVVARKLATVDEGRQKALDTAAELQQAEEEAEEGMLAALAEEELTAAASEGTDDGSEADQAEHPATDHQGVEEAGTPTKPCTVPALRGFNATDFPRYRCDNITQAAVMMHNILSAEAYLVRPIPHDLCDSAGLDYPHYIQSSSERVSCKGIIALCDVIKPPLEAQGHKVYISKGEDRKRGLLVRVQPEQAPTVAREVRRQLTWLSGQSWASEALQRLVDWAQLPPGSPAAVHYEILMRTMSGDSDSDDPAVWLDVIAQALVQLREAELGMALEAGATKGEPPVAPEPRQTRKRAAEAALTEEPISWGGRGTRSSPCTAGAARIGRASAAAAGGMVDDEAPEPRQTRKRAAGNDPAEEPISWGGKGSMSACRTAGAACIGDASAVTIGGMADDAGVLRASAGSAAGVAASRAPPAAVSDLTAMEATSRGAGIAPQAGTKQATAGGADGIQNADNAVAQCSASAEEAAAGAERAAGKLVQLRNIGFLEEKSVVPILGDVNFAAGSPSPWILQVGTGPSLCLVQPVVGRRTAPIKLNSALQYVHALALVPIGQGAEQGFGLGSLLDLHIRTPRSIFLAQRVRGPVSEADAAGKNISKKDFEEAGLWINAETVQDSKALQQAITERLTVPAVQLAANRIIRQCLDLLKATFLRAAHFHSPDTGPYSKAVTQTDWKRQPEAWRTALSELSDGWRDIFKTLDSLPLFTVSQLARGIYSVRERLAAAGIECPAEPMRQPVQNHHNQRHREGILAFRIACLKAQPPIIPPTEGYRCNAYASAGSKWPKDRSARAAYRLEVLDEWMQQMDGLYPGFGEAVAAAQKADPSVKGTQIYIHWCQWAGGAGWPRDTVTW